MNINQFNELQRAQAEELLLSCCAAPAWANKVLEARPYGSLEQLESSADRCWMACDEAQWLEAFSAHPRIGDVEYLRKRFNSVAVGEQGQVLRAREETLVELKQLNDVYYERFGFIFIVLASGKSAEQMLSILQQRIALSRDDELYNAAIEQGKILRLRLRQRFLEDTAA